MTAPWVDDRPSIAAYFQAGEKCFQTAMDRHVTEDLWLRIARRSVRLRFAGSGPCEVIGAAFAHLRRPPQRTADLTILAWETASTSVLPPPLPPSAGRPDRAGKLPAVCDARFTVAHAPDTSQLWMLDRGTATAVVWIGDVDRIPLWDRIHPLRHLLHEWARGFGADLVHAGAVGIDGVGVLVVGPGGTGKSTTVLAAMAAGLPAAGDDYVLVDAGSAAGLPPTAHGLYGTMRLHQAHLDRFPGLLPQHDHVFEEPWSGRAKVTSYISRHRPDRLTAELRLVGIVIPQVVGDDLAELTRETPARALVALAPSSLLQVDPTDRAMFGRLACLCRTLPCWRLPLGPDLRCAADRVAQLIRART